MMPRNSLQNRLITACHSRLAPQWLQRRSFLAVAWLFAVSPLLIAAPLFAGDPPDAKPMDWPHWRGPEMNGVSREKGLVDKWSPKGENLLWKREDLGSRSTPIVMNGKLYLITRDRPETPKEGERVVCLDAATGKTIWENRFNVFLSDVPDTRVGWSSVTGDPTTGNIYALGVCGYFQCIDGESGVTIWSHSLSEEFGLLSTYGGRTNFPLVQDDLVIISSVVIGWGDMAKPAHRFIGFDKESGEPVWFTSTRLFPYDTTYSAPVSAVVDGQKMIVFASGDGGVHAFQPRTGKEIWSYDVSYRGVNTTPLVVGNKVYCGHSEENIDSRQMGALFCIDATKSGDITQSGEVWRNREMFVGKSSPLYVDGRIYACEDTGTLLVVDAKTGERITKFKLRGPMRSSPIYADGKIYICTENTIWWTLKPTESGVEKVFGGRLDAGSCYGSPVVSHARLYVPTTQGMYCVGNPDVQPTADPRAELPQETPVADDPTPAQVQVVPVEALLRPGEQQQYSVRLYNAKGQLLKQAENVEFHIDGPGEISSAGKYSTPASAGSAAAVIVTAKVGKLTGQARIRMMPDLPWKLDFSDGIIPVTWVGARYRNICVDYEFFETLRKQDPRTADMYLYLMTAFTNGNPKQAVFDDTNPRRRNWNGLLIYFGLDSGTTKPQTVDEAKQAFDPALTALKQQNFVADWSWESIENVGIRLTVNRGSRKEVANGAMLKIRTIPLGTKSQGWMGQTDLHDYTIQADVMGLARGDKIPDIGIIGQRYTFDMMGASQQLQIRTWPPQLRMAQTIPFEWKTNVWYTMKLRTAVEGGKAVLRGKVWVRGEEEPADWMIEAVDVSPNVIGSPGIFGNARDTEIFYDNFVITAN